MASVNHCKDLAFVPFAGLDFCHIATDQGMFPLMLAKSAHDVVLVACVKPVDEAGDQVVVLRRFVYGGQFGTGDLSLS